MKSARVFWTFQKKVSKILSPIHIRCATTVSSFLGHSLFELGHVLFIAHIITYKWRNVKKILKNNLKFLKTERGAQESTSRQFLGPSFRSKFSVFLGIVIYHAFPLECSHKILSVFGYYQSGYGLGVLPIRCFCMGWKMYLPNGDQ